VSQKQFYLQTIVCDTKGGDSVSTIQANQKHAEQNLVNPALFENLSFEELMERAETVVNSDPEYAFKLTQYAEDLAQQFGDTEKVAQAKSLKGASLYKLDKPKEAIKELDIALKIAKETLLICELSNRMAYCYWVLTENKKTILLAKEALKLLDSTHDSKATKQKVFSYNCLGIAYYQLGIPDFAVTAYLSGLEIADKSDPQVTFLNNNLSLVLKEMGDFDKAFKYNQKALELSLQQNDKRQEALCVGNLAHLYLLQAEYPNVIKYSKQSLDIEQASLETKLHQYHNLAEALLKMGEYCKAKVSIEKAKSTLNQFPRNYIKCDILKSEADVYVAQSKFPQAEKVLLEVIDIATNSENLKVLYETHAALSNVYESLEEFKKALDHQKLFHIVKTQVHNETMEKRIQGLTIQHEVEELTREKEQTVEENIRLEKLVHQRTIEIEEAHMEMLERLAIAGEKRDDDTGEHTARVGRVCGLIAKELGCDDIYVDTIKIAARLHDVGKIGVPDSILLKPSKLTDSEFEVVKTHAAIGAEMLTNSKSKLFQMAEKIAGTHHEKWNGRGYPNGLKGKEIPLEGRIVAVADVYDALTNDRPYKDTWTHEAALEELFRSADSHLDRKVVEAFSRLFDKGIVVPEDLKEKAKKQAKIYDAYDQEIFADES